MKEEDNKMNTKQAILCMGSNQQAAEQIGRAQELLRGLLPGIRFTRTLKTEPIGIESAPFGNCLAQAETTLTAAELNNHLKQIEAACGNTQALRKQNIIRMDIDLLQLGETRYHEADWERPFVRLLLKEIIQSGKPQR